MIKNLCEKLHATDTLAVLAITGGGTEAIGELLRHGNGSRTLLEAVVPYSQVAFENFLGGKPDKFCSEAAARQMAMTAYQRAMRLAGKDSPVLGLGCSCSLAKNNERAGRSHQIYVGLQTADHTVTWSTLLDHGRSREEEEHIACELIFNALLEGCGVPERLSTAITPERKEAQAGEFLTLIRGDFPWVHFPFKDCQWKPCVVFPGAFNPLHEGHRSMARHAAALTGKPVLAEISVANVDKPFLDYIDLEHRLQGLKDSGQDVFEGVMFTRMPTFAAKAQHFYGHTFIVGMDTMDRIANVRYYNNDPRRQEDAFTILHKQEARFLVYPRIYSEKKFDRSVYDRLPPALLDISHLVEDFEPVDLSSTRIRQEKP